MGIRDPEARANYWRCPKCGAVEDTVFAERDAAEYLRLGGSVAQDPIGFIADGQTHTSRWHVRRVRHGAT